MRLPILKKKRKVKPIKIYNNGAVSVTRAGLSSNPVQRYSFTSGDIFQNNSLVQHGNSFFVGGDTATYEFDFGIKVAGSVAECPMRISRTAATVTTINPTDASWSEVTVQNELDGIKTQDGTSRVGSTSASGYIYQYLVELDLTPLCNSMFGGSNSALKSALKSITVDTWAMGSGSNAGVQTSGVTVAMWGTASGGKWMNDPVYGFGASNGWNTSSSSSITDIPVKANVSLVLNYVLPPSNKIYILIASQYPSGLATDNVTQIASSVSLDYINIKVDLTRAVDTVTPISVNLPQYFGLFGGFSPCFDTNSSNVERAILTFKQGSDNIEVYAQSATKYLNIYSSIGGATGSIQGYDLKLNPKYKDVKFYFQQKPSGSDLFILPNNDTTKKYTSSSFKTFSGLCQMLIGQYTSNNYQADAFAESFNLIDLQRLNKPNGFTDAEADGILRGVLPNPLGIQNPELFDINKVTLHANAKLVNGTIVLNATANYQYSYLVIPVLPNNRYEFKVTSNANSYVKEQYNNIYIKSTTYVGNQVVSFVTSPNTNNIKITFDNGTSTGTFTFSNISLRRKD